MSIWKAASLLLAALFMMNMTFSSAGARETDSSKTEKQTVSQSSAASPAAKTDTVNVPYTLHGHSMEIDGQEEGRTYFFIVLGEQPHEAKEVEVTFTREGKHSVWATGRDGSTIKVGSSVYDKGTHTISITKDMARLEFNVFTEEVPYLGLKVPGGITVSKSAYAGRYLSVLGDSLSAANPWQSAENDPNAYGMTTQWWYLAAKELGMNLLVNNSVGGTGVYHEGSAGSSGTGLNRCVELHTAARDPDDIFVMLSINDVFNGYTVEQVKEGYEEMVRKMQNRYPEADIVLFTYPYIGSVKSFAAYKPGMDQLNAAIRAVAESRGVKLVDLSVCPFTTENIQQYIRSAEDFHYNRSGHALIGAEAVKGLKSLASAPSAG